MAMTSFYGGPKGQDFEINHIFSNKAELIADLEQRWVSPVSLGSYVMISYGGNLENLSKDGGQSFNSTLWRKIYVEEEKAGNISNQFTDIVYCEGTNYGFAYGLISTLTGATPKITAVSKTISASSDPAVEVNFLNSNLETPEITFSLPKAWDIQKGEDVPLNADQLPSVNVGEDSVNSIKTFTFFLPRSQVLGLGNVTIATPDTQPAVIFNGEGEKVNNPTIDFILPRAVQFYYGSGTDGVTNSGAKVGDYYIDKDTAYIYTVTENNELVFKANLSGEKPIIKETVSLNPYDQTGKAVEPSVRAGFDNPTDKKGYFLEFSLPKAPEITANFNELAPAAASELKSEVVQTGINLTFDIARGARWFTSATTSINVAGAKSGDYCLIGGETETDNNRGDVYQLTDSGWVNTGYSIKGNTGSGVKVLDKIIVPSNITNNEASVGAYIYQQLGNKYPNNDQVVPVDYTTTDGQTISYWYYYVDGKWFNQIISGGAAGIILDQEDKQNSTSKGYSTRYLNEQLGLKAAQSYVDNALSGKVNTSDYNSLNNAVTSLSNNALTKTEAKNTYLTIATAEIDYLTSESAKNIYLTKNDAGNTYLTSEDAENTYLTKNDANNSENGYLKINDASSTYLTIDSAKNNYEPLITANKPLSTVKGGTGTSVSSLTELKTYLGITAVESNISTINSNITSINNKVATAESNIANIQNTTSLKPKTGTVEYDSSISLEVGQMYLMYES